MRNHIAYLIAMPNFKENIEKVKRMAGKGAETALTTLFCSAFVLSPGKSKVGQPEVKHSGNGHTGITPLEEGVIYFHDGVTASTSFDGSLAVAKDFPRGREHNGRAEFNLIGGDSHKFERPDTPKPIGRNGARGMYTRKQPHQLTDADFRSLRGE